MLANVAVTLPRWPIVGRRLELEVFERAMGSGELAGMVIYGRAGVGKHGWPMSAVSRPRLPATRPYGWPAAGLPRCCRWVPWSRS